jgi:opacity protein-like surface antigen
MKKLLFLASLVVLCLPLAALAQEEAPKVEISGGYSFLRLNLNSVPGISDLGGATLNDVDTHGFNVSFAGNIVKHVGIISEFSQYTKTDSANNIIRGPIIVTGPTLLSGVDVKLKVSTLLFGPRVTLHRGRVEPFVHGLFGAARASIEGSALGVSADDAAYAFAYALGGGVDVKVHKNLAIRVAQVDYLGTKAGDENLNNFRFSVGVVLRLGNR